jgi:hypothetical protein
MPRVKGKSRLQTDLSGSENCSSKHNPEVAGSNPAPATTYTLTHICKMCVRVFFGGVAQWLERWLHKPCVVGSNPSPATNWQRCLSS